MEPYITLFGRILRLAQLPQHVRSLISQIIGAYQIKEVTPDVFATTTRALLCNAYPARQHYHRMMRGVVGEIFRDCYYRLHLSRFDQDQAQLVLEQLRFNPLRLLYDYYLDDDQTQQDFAVRAGVNPAPLSRAFRLVLYAKTETTGEISLTRLTKCFQQLSIVPCIVRE